MSKMDALTEREFYALLILNYCDVGEGLFSWKVILCGFLDTLALPEDVIRSTQRIRSRAFEELQEYYRSELKLGNFSQRIGNMATLAQGMGVRSKENSLKKQCRISGSRKPDERRNAHVCDHIWPVYGRPSVSRVFSTITTIALFYCYYSFSMVILTLRTIITCIVLRWTNRTTICLVGEETKQARCSLSYVSYFLRTLLGEVRVRRFLEIFRMPMSMSTSCVVFFLRIHQKNERKCAQYISICASQIECAQLGSIFSASLPLSLVSSPRCISRRCFTSTLRGAMNEGTIARGIEKRA